MEKERIDRAAETLNNYDNKDQEQVIKKLRGRMKKPKQKEKLDRLVSTLNNLNKIKELKNKLKKNQILKKDIRLQEGEKVGEKEKEKLPEEELNSLTEGFVVDLYNEQEDEPKTRAEKREADKEKEEKMKNVAKAINSLNKDDQKIVLKKLDGNANNDKKKEQFNKLNNLIKNTNNLKSYINKLIKEKINQTKDKENKKNELPENDIEDLNNKFAEDLFPNKDKIIDETKVDDKHLEKIDDEKINKAVDIIKDLNSEQQKKVLGNLKSKAAEEKNLEKYNKVVKKMKNVLKIDKIINKLSKGKLEAVRKHEGIKSNFTNTPRNIEFEKISESEKEKKRKKSHELTEEEFLDLAENVLTCVFEEDENKDVPMNKVEKYIDKKEEDENIDKVADIINNLHNNDKENMLHILNDNADNKKKTSILKKLTNKIHKKEHKHKKHKDKDKNKEENNFAYDIIKAFNNNKLNEFVEKIELNDDQLGNFTNDVIGDLFKNNEKMEENEEEKNINKAANAIKELNKNDQTKVLTFLKENANDENKKEKIEKVNSLVNSMNGIKQYVKGIIKKRIVKDKNNEKKELEKDKLKDLSENMLNDLYEEDKKDDDIEKETPGEEEKLNNMANKLNKLNENDKKKVLNILEENAKNDKKQKILNNLKNKVRKINHARILSDNMRIKTDENKESEKEKEKEKEKSKLTEEEINDMAYQFSVDLYHKEHKPTNSFEDFIMKENKENKVEEMAESIKKLDKDYQEKALSIINKNAIDDDQEEKAQNCLI